MGGETPAPDGVFLNPTYRETWEARERRLRQVLSILQALLQRLSRPLPSEWWTDRTSTSHLLIGSPAGDLSPHVFRFYAHLYDQTPGGDDYMADDAVTRFLQAAFHPYWEPERYTRTGINICVADPDRKPLEYFRLWGTLPQTGTTIEVLQDWRGRYFYNRHSRRQYLPDRP